MIPSEFNQDMMAQRHKLHILHEARGRSGKFKIGDRVKLTGKSGETQKKNGFSTTGKIKDAQISSGRRFFRVGWDDGKNSSLFDLQSRLGLDVVKEEFVFEGSQVGGPGSVGKKPGQGRSRLTTVKVGVAWNIFRIFGEKVFGDEQEVERMPGVFKSRQAANKAAKEIAAKTGESLRNEKGRR